MGSIEQLYQWEKTTRELIQKMRRPLGLQEILQLFVNELGATLKVDRCFVIEFDRGRPRPITIEYLADSNVETYRGITLAWETPGPYLQAAVSKELVCINQADDTVTSCFQNFLSESLIQGLIASPIVYNEQLLNVVVLHTQMPRKWTQFDIALLKVVTEQVAISIHYANVIEYLRELEAERERLWLVIQGSGDGIFDWNLNDDTSYVNDRYYELLGLPPDTPKGYIDFMQRVHPADRERVADKLRQHFQENEPYEIEFRLRHASGVYRTLYTRGAAIRDSEGMPIRMAGVLTDITLLKTAEKSVQ